MKEENFRTKREENPPPSLPIIYVLNNIIVAKEKEKEKRRERKGREREAHFNNVRTRGRERGGKETAVSCSRYEGGAHKDLVIPLIFFFFLFSLFSF